MDELDQFKKQWKEDQNFNQLNQADLKTMLHKSSSSIVKWIFILSCAEFLIGIILNYLIIKDKEPNQDFLSHNFIYILYYITLAIFVSLFLINYNKIKNYENTKKLSADILKTRKLLTIYIVINFIFIALDVINGLFDRSIINSFIKGFNDGGHEKQADIVLQNNGSFMDNMIIFIALIIVLSIFFIFLWLCYKYVYFRLIKKLNKNYKELSQLEED